MKITAIMGSHRSNGHTNKILNHFLEQLPPEHEVKLINVNKVHVEHCKGCDYCLKHQGTCVIKDDEMPWIYEAFTGCDLLVIASPVYFSAFPSKLKTIIDRTQMLYNLKDRSHIPDKKLIFIGVGGAPAYKHQFRGLEYTLEWYVKNLNAIPSAFVEIPHTDETPALENQNALQELEALAEQIKNN
ncbi:MAG: flavodoxin family protein [Eubacterium sp.]